MSTIYSAYLQNDKNLENVHKLREWIDEYFTSAKNELPLSIWLKCLEEIHKINYDAKFIAAQIEDAETLFNNKDSISKDEFRNFQREMLKK